LLQGFFNHPGRISPSGFEILSQALFRLDPISINRLFDKRELGPATLSE
jgi:hypothetical protein